MNLLKRFLLQLALVFCFVLIAIAPAVAQNSGPTKAQTIKYELGLRYGDMDVAKDAIYQRIADEPTNISLLDTLAMLYFDYQKYTSCILVCRDLLSNNPSHMQALEMSAISFENLGLKDKALANYESIYLKNNSRVVLYKMAALQYELKRYIEGVTNLDILLKDPKVDEEKVGFNTQQGPTEVPLKAAVYNLKGLIQKEEGKKEEAKGSFEAALKTHPDFSYAQENLKSLEN